MYECGFADDGNDVEQQQNLILILLYSSSSVDSSIEMLFIIYLAICGHSDRRGTMVWLSFILQPLGARSALRHLNSALSSWIGIIFFAVVY